MSTFPWGIGYDSQMKIQFEESEQQTILKVFESLKHFSKTIVFGNASRKKILIRYYLDLYFDSIIELESECTPNQKYDCLAWFEPDFCSVIMKPDNVKHLIVFTSHLNLNFACDCRIVVLHLGRLGTDISPLASRCINVSNVKSVHKAFLKILTKLEKISNEPVKINVSNKIWKSLSINLKISFEKLHKYCRHDLLDKMYLNIFIQNK